MNNAPIVRDVVLVGGGHSHVLLIRRWAMRPIAGVRLTLVSSAVQTPYSGMLPGLIAGHYSIDETHIDLMRLCAWANVRFVAQTVTGLDLQEKCIKLEARPDMGFDILSLDTGSTPDLSVPGAKDHVTPVKPVSNFYERWQAIVQRVENSGSRDVSIGVVGSGAGGFELISAMRHALPEHKARCVWFLRNERPLRGRPSRVGQLALAAARSNNIEIINQCDITHASDGYLQASDGRSFELDEVLWCTAAVGPDWPRLSGLGVDDRGFVATNAYLQSISHDFVFATGDIGTQVDTPISKAGVFAVRQAPILHANIIRLLLDQPLKKFKPQKDFLSLMATGPKRAIASRGSVAIEADWVWRWKDWIDQRFMDQFRELPPVMMNASLARLPNALNPVRSPHDNRQGSLRSQASTMARCRGCGAKVGDQVLQAVLSKFPENERMKQSRTSALSISPAEDTAVLECSTGSLVQSVDNINAIVDDPYLLGRIAALHALSDVVTMDATLHSAQVLVTLPEASDSIVERDLMLLMKGVIESLNSEDCALLGGHTTQGPELSIGLVVNASLNQKSNSSSQASISHGDALVLTKSLGVGILFAGLMQQKARGDDVAGAIDAMLISNRCAADVLRRHDAKVMTDVTGFGLLGHLERLISNMECGASLLASVVPLQSGALFLSEAGVRSSLWVQNSAVLDRTDIGDNLSPDLIALLCDPQTSGGLLAIVPADQVTACVAQLHAKGYPDAIKVGVIERKPGVRVAA